MKPLNSLWIIILLIGAKIVIAKRRTRTSCQENGGSCIMKRDVEKNCVKRLGYKCRPRAVCCREGHDDMKSKPRRIEKQKKDKGRGDSVATVRRLCMKIQNECAKAGGICIPSGSQCNTLAVDDLCNGASCSCCLGESGGCGASLACRFHGGFCISKDDKENNCDGGATDNDLCDGKSCTCCKNKRKCRCGQANEQRIVGGKEVSLENKYPWHVGLKFVEDPFYFCGGTLINDRYVLTAAHCLYDSTKKAPFKAKDMRVGLADHNQYSTDDDLLGVTRLVYVKKIIIHRKYDDDLFPMDIGLIKLKVPLDMTAEYAVRTACLPTDRENTYEREKGTAIGWGSPDYDEELSPAVLTETKLKILSPSCPSDHEDYGEITSDMLCAGRAKGGKGTCLGDSGGPLLVIDDGKYTVVGLTSYNVGCGKPNLPSVFARVTEFLDWIMRHTRDANYCL